MGRHQVYGAFGYSTHCFSGRSTVAKADIEGAQPWLRDMGEDKDDTLICGQMTWVH